MYTCLRVSGEDRSEFLQGQLTQNVADLAKSGSLPAAWCSPKGRVIVTGRLLELDDAIGFIVPGASTDAVLKRLSMYRLRSHVDIETDPSVLSLALPADRLPEALRSPGSETGASAVTGRLAIVRLSDSVLEVHGPAEAIDGAGLAIDDRLDDLAWRGARIEAGLVDVDAGNAERFTPHMLNLDRIGAISFNKGCYTGQEVVARTENLGRVKRRANRYRLAAGTASPGDRLSAGNDMIGEVVNVAGPELLAVVPVDRADEALTLNGTAADPRPLPYALD